MNSSINLARPSIISQLFKVLLAASVISCVSCTTTAQVRETASNAASVVAKDNNGDILVR